MAVKMKICPVEDGGLIKPIKFKPHLEKGKSGSSGCKGMEEKCSLPTNFWNLSQDLTNL
jgi:hypothetical protein